MKKNVFTRLRQHMLKWERHIWLRFIRRQDPNNYNFSIFVLHEPLFKFIKHEIIHWEVGFLVYLKSAQFVVYQSLVIVKCIVKRNITKTTLHLINSFLRLIKLNQNVRLPYAVALSRFILSILRPRSGNISKKVCSKVVMY